MTVFSIPIIDKLDDAIVCLLVFGRFCPQENANTNPIKKSIHQNRILLSYLIF